MILAATDGTRVALTPVAYQFPDLAPRDCSGPDHDVNWLIIKGELDLPGGRRHAFEDPSLLTWEALRLADWLDGVAVGEPPEDLDGCVDFEAMEPCLRLRSSGRGSGHEVAVRVYLSLEAEPPFVVAGAAGLHRNYVPLLMESEALTAAAHVWRKELTPFPVRGDID